MVLHIQYQNNKFDYVNHYILDRLINTRRIKRFFRPSEEKWFIIGVDSIRGNGGDFEGYERRHTSYPA